MLVKHELNGNFKPVNIEKRGNKLCQQAYEILTNLKKYDKPVELPSNNVEDLNNSCNISIPVNQTFYLNIFKTAFNSANGDTGTEENDVEYVDGEPNNVDLDKEFIN